MTEQCPCPAADFLHGVAIPTGGSHRILIVDRTQIDTEVWARFNMADIHIRARTPIVYTMCHRNLTRLKEAIDDALAQLDAQHTHEAN